MVVGFLIHLLCAVVNCAPDFGQPGDGLVAPRLGARVFDLNGSVLQPPLVETSGGSLEGYFMKTISGRDIYAFEGIPFAEAPVGERRFRLPVPKKPWRGIRSAKVSAPYCLQMHTFFLNRIMGVEDCLKLNVYTPKLPSDGQAHPKYPVIIFIHGGSYQFGGAIEQGPAYLLERNVVLVTINYRLGILGYISTGDKASPGNLGMKDQALAIEWVHKNVENFGGDSGKVTLMGESAGATSVHLHMLSQRETKNYFHRAISMSGTAFNFWALHSNHLAGRWTSLAARYARCPESSTEKLMNCLRSRNPVRLVSNQFKMLEYYPNFPSVMFAPVVEPKSSHAFLTETPEEIYARNGTLPIPYIASNVEEEGEPLITILPVILLFSPFQKEWRKLAPVMFAYSNIKGVNKDSITDAIEKYYFKNKTARNFELPGFSRMISDRYFSPGIYRGLQLHSQIAPTYSSVFNYRGRFGIPTSVGLGPERPKYKVGHSEDLFYVFNMSTYSQGLKLTDPEYEISKFMVNSIVNFAETGVPDVSKISSVTWPPVDPKDVRQLVINDVIQIAPYPKTSLDAIEFWNSLNLTDSKSIVKTSHT